MPTRNFQLGVAVALLLGLLFAMPAAAQKGMGASRPALLDRL